MDGSTLSAVCRAEGMPKRTTFLDWVKKDSALADRYARAREIGAYAMADDLLDIADDKTRDTRIVDGREVADTEWITRSRLRVDTRKWLVARILPWVFGDKPPGDAGAGEMVIRIERVAKDPPAPLHPATDGQ